MRPRIWLVTGFEPFSRRKENSSELLVHDCPANFENAGVPLQLEKTILPVKFETAREILIATIERLRPEGVLCLGEAATPTVRLERWARSQDFSQAADNAGVVRNQVLGETPQLKPSRLDLDTIAEALRAQNVPTEFSDDAGGFVCNHVFYGLQRYVELSSYIRNSGFIHVPINYRAYFTARNFWSSVFGALARPEN